MKRLILITIMMLAFTSTTNALKESTVSKTAEGISTVYKDSKDGVTTVYKDLKATAPHVKDALASLSKELETTTDALWEILVKQQVVWSWGILVLTLSAMFNWILFYRRNLRKVGYEKVKVKVQKLAYPDGVTEKDILANPNYSPYQKKYRSVEEEGLKAVPDATIPYFKYYHLIICVTLSFFSILYFSKMLTGFINPEFGALKTITEVVRTLK